MPHDSQKVEHMQLLFQFLSFAPGPFWLLILFLPGNRWAMLAVDLFLILLAGLFAWQTIPIIPQILPLLLEPKFDEMHAFLSSEAGFVGSWNHMILSDLWIGRWVAQDTRQFSRPLLVRLLCIPPILLFGPLGLFCYLLLRMAACRKLAINSPSSPNPAVID